jgi:hypothetical protein
MPQEEIAIDIGTHDAHFLAVPPWRFEGSPICHSDKAGDFNLTVDEVDCSAPAHMINGALELLVVLRHSANAKTQRRRATEPEM